MGIKLVNNCIIELQKYTLASLLSYIASFKQLQYSNKMQAENIFMDLERSHPNLHSLKDLQSLKKRGSLQQIKAYFQPKAISGSKLVGLTTQQIHKAQRNLRSLRLRQIYAEKSKKLNPLRKNEQGLSLGPAKSSNTTLQSSQEEEVSQYLSLHHKAEQQVDKVE